MKILPVFILLAVFAAPVFAQNCLENAKVVAPTLSAETRKTYETKLAEAKADLEKSPTADATIWVGRRTAYLGNYKEAIKIFTGGIEKFPKDARFYRHRGHRFITIRCFDDAIKDFEKAANLVKGKADEIEPDGLPNAQNIPTSTLQSNIFYHLGLAYYLKGDFKKALKAYREAEKVSKNPDMLVATTHWLYMTLRRMGNTKEAEKSVAKIADDLGILENADYYKLVKLYQGKLKAADLQKEIGEKAGTLSNASLGYGLGNWFLYNGKSDEATKLFRQITIGNQWASFGFIAAETDILQENATGEVSSSCVKLELVEQKKLPPFKEKMPPDYFVFAQDDIEAKFKLTNNCNKAIYYLGISFLKKRGPTGFMIYKTKDKEWFARTPAWEAERSLTSLSATDRWMPLLPSESVGFIFTDLSKIEGERSIAIYVNRVPSPIGRLEMRVNPYKPIEIDQ